VQEFHACQGFAMQQDKHEKFGMSMKVANCTKSEGITAFQIITCGN